MRHVWDTTFKGSDSSDPTVYSLYCASSIQIILSLALVHMCSERGQSKDQGTKSFAKFFSQSFSKQCGREVKNHLSKLESI